MEPWECLRSIRATDRDSFRRCGDLETDVAVVRQGLHVNDDPGRISHCNSGAVEGGDGDRLAMAGQHRFLQGNLNDSAGAQDLLLQTMLEWSVDLAVVAEPYYVSTQPNWAGDVGDSVAIIAAANSLFLCPTLRLDNLRVTICP